MTKVVIVQSTPCAPDHIHTRTYNEGEEYEVGSDLMPLWLSENLIHSGIAEEVQKVMPVTHHKEPAQVKVPEKKPEVVVEDLELVDKSKEKPVPHVPGPSEIKHTTTRHTTAARTHVKPDTKK